MIDGLKPPLDDRIKLARIDAYIGLDRYDEALRAINTMIIAAPRHTDYRLTKARIQIAHGETKGAQTTLLAIHSYAPTDEDAYAALFNLYASRGWSEDLDDWGRLLREVRERMPSSRIAKLKTAQAYSWQDRHEEAEALIKRALALKPELKAHCR